MILLTRFVMNMSCLLETYSYILARFHTLKYTFRNSIAVRLSQLLHEYSFNGKIELRMMMNEKMVQS